MKSGVMMLKIQLCITEINYIWTYIQIEKSFIIVIIFHNIIILYCIFDQINAVLVSLRYLF